MQLRPGIEKVPFGCRFFRLLFLGCIRSERLHNIQDASEVNYFLQLVLFDRLAMKIPICESSHPNARDFSECDIRICLAIQLWRLLLHISGMDRSDARPSFDLEPSDRRTRSRPQFLFLFCSWFWEFDALDDFAFDVSIHGIFRPRISIIPARAGDRLADWDEDRPANPKE